VSAGKAGLELDAVNRHYPRVDTVPFESEHQYMATLHALPHGEGALCSSGAADAAAPPAHRVYVKGALEKILDRCSCQMQADGGHGPVQTEWVLEQATAFATEGMRVLGLASKDLSTDIDDITHEHVSSELVFLGVQGMIDPPRNEALQAIKACHEAGIEVKMITGDHALTAVAIAKALDLHCHPGSPGATEGAEPKALSGSQLAAISDADLVAAARETSVFARVTPEEKLRLVTALQKDGNIVAMTGDGVNDAPALRQADIGVAMGITGTEVAKEAADMVLADDNFASIEAAVEEGRGVFDNITKFITWTLPTNLGEGLVILAAIFAGVALPILPVQILWINMTTAVLLGLMLAFEPKEKGIMSRPPRSPKAALLNRVLVRHILIVGIMLLAGSFGLFEWARDSGRSLEEARTIATNVFVFGQIFYLFNCRSLTLPSWRVPPFSNHFLLGGVGLMLALQMLYTYLPVMNTLFRTAPIVLRDWAWIILIGIGVHVVIEIEKGIRRGYHAYQQRRE
jgi:cation-transporting ATPase F